MAAVVLLAAVLLLVQWPLGDLLGRTLTSRRHLAVERFAYRLVGVAPDAEQAWSAYAVAVVAFSGVGILLLYALLRLQGALPESLGLPGVPPAGSLNTAISFVTNTNWQWYAGESTLGYLVQAAALTVQNFLSAAVGVAVAFALMRGFARSRAGTIGNFWVDITRVTVRVLLPLSLVASVVLIAGGVIQNLHDPMTITTLAGGHQTLPGGPVATQEAIKELGTNGGGFFNANSAHPFENPNAFTNVLEIWALLVIPAAAVLAFGRTVGDTRQGAAVLATMTIMLLVGVLVAYHYEGGGNPILTALGVDPAQGNMEGKELRFGAAMSALFATATTGTSTGAVNSMHDSFLPLAGLVPLFNMLLGSIAPGGVGAGLYGFLVVVVIAVFVAGLMVGRTPEYLGKKIEAREMKLAMLAVLIYPLSVLGFSASSVMIRSALDSLNNAGPHGLSEILYAFASANDNNGSAFAGLSGNTLWYNSTLGLAMFLGRFAYIIPVLAMAGTISAKKKAPASAGTFPTHGPLFVGLLLGVILILYLLQYFPALALGPIVEHLLLSAGKTF